MGKSPLFRVTRAVTQLHRELARLDQETWEELADEIEALYESIVCLVARIGQIAGAPADEIETLLRRRDEEE